MIKDLKGKNIMRGEMEDVKKCQMKLLKLKNGIWNVKWNIKINRLGNIDEKISELEDTDIETIQIEVGRNKT